MNKLILLTVSIWLTQLSLVNNVSASDEAARIMTIAIQADCMLVAWEEQYRCVCSESDIRLYISAYKLRAIKPDSVAELRVLQEIAIRWKRKGFNNPVAATYIYGVGSNVSALTDEQLGAAYNQVCFTLGLVATGSDDPAALYMLVNKPSEKADTKLPEIDD